MEGSNNSEVKLPSNTTEVVPSMLIERKLNGTNQKGLALANIEPIKVDQPVEKSFSASSGDLNGADSGQMPTDQSDDFEKTFKELKKWVDVRSTKYSTLLVVRERRTRRLGTALKVLNDTIQDDPEPPKKKLYDLKVQLLDEIGWAHVASYERQWMHVRFPSSSALF